MNVIKLETLLKQFFNEDIGDGDLSSEFLFSQKDLGSFTFFAKNEGVFCGEQIILRGFRLLDPAIRVISCKQDGDIIKHGDTIAVINGPLPVLLTGERVVLNLVQRMCAIATMAKKAMDQTAGTNARVCDTRKTMPGLRMLDKYAVRTGGAFNHRSGLYDAIMLKDNHIAFAGSITKAVALARKRVGHTVKIEVEIETKEQLEEAIAAQVDIIMFDNCSPETIASWLPLVPEHIATEASGGITIDTVADFAASGVEWISLGALTHSVEAFDISALVESKGEMQVVNK